MKLKHITMKAAAFALRVAVVGAVVFGAMLADGTLTGTTPILPGLLGLIAASLLAVWGFQASLALDYLAERLRWDYIERKRSLRRMAAAAKTEQEGQDDRGR